MTHFFETLFYRPQWYHWVVSMLLSPISLLYGLGMWVRRKLARRKHYAVPILSVGNLVIGGSGKTPFVIALAEYFSDRKVVIISRGYGRQSSGLVEVSCESEVLVAVEQSGDEAMLMAIRSPHASVIVSEHRGIAIEKAIEKGAELILLDDGFNRVEIEKCEIVLEPELLPNRLVLPAGPMREFCWSRAEADLIYRENIDFCRGVRYQNLKDKMLLVTAISNPSRLDRYLPEGVVAKVTLEDHAYFEETKLRALLKQHQAESLLVTEKDWVKMRAFDLPLSLMTLELHLNDGIISEIEAYIKEKQ
jgi:tetraacyldisaccharide 4'-kinase